MPKTVLITGGSSGIGLELAKCFANDGYNLLIVSKPPEEIAEASTLLKQQFPNLRIKTLAKDLTDANAAQDVHEWSKQQAKQVDILVNNAGFGTYGFLNDISMEKELAMIQLNLVCVYTMTRLFLKDMLQRNDGAIMNIASIASFMPAPYMTTYGATKAFIHNFTRALNYELRQEKKNIHVMAVCPTQVRTKFQQAADMEKVNTFDSIFTINPETVARDAYKALKNKRPVVIPKKSFELLNYLVKRLPTSIQMRLAHDNLKVK